MSQVGGCRGRRSRPLHPHHWGGLEGAAGPPNPPNRPAIFLRVPLKKSTKKRMIITILCIAVVVISIVAVGTPLRWLLNSRRPLGTQEWIEAPFVGIAAIVLVLQNLAYLDLPVRYASVLVWILACAGWAGMYRA